MRFTPSPEDFSVEEVPRASPSGEGAHLWIEVEKRGIGTPEALRRIAAHLGASEAAIGHAGLKDAHARTTQWLSLEGVAAADLARIEDGALRVLRAARHGEKLALGALAGNRFRVHLRDVAPGEAEAARERLQRFAREGVPNFFGAQRFGIRGLGARIGRAVLLGEARLALDLLLGCPRPVEGERLRGARTRYERGDLAGALRGFPESFAPERRALDALLAGAAPAAALSAVPWKTREVYLSAYQAELFNRLLAERVAAETHATVERGDVAIEHASGEEFARERERVEGGRVPAEATRRREWIVEDEARERARAARLEVSASAPLYGHAVARATGRPGEREAALLASERIGWETWRGPPGLALRGARRPLRFAVREVILDAPAPGELELEFFLGPGSYATTLVEQLGARIESGRDRTG